MISSTTRPTGLISLIILLAICSSRSCGNRAQSAGHRVVAGDRSDHDNIAVCPFITLDSDGADIRQHAERLPQIPVKARLADLVLEDRVGLAEDLEPLLRHLAADDPDREPWTRERLAPDESLGQAKLGSHGTHLVLEQRPQRLDELELQILGQSADVVVRLDRRRAGTATGFDHVRVERPLDEEPHVLELGRLLLEHTDELGADHLALPLGVVDAPKPFEESLLSVHQNSRQATYVQQEYAIRNPMQFVGYGEYCWGFTACDGPGWVKRTVNGIERQFFDYLARGAPYGPDDGTVAPWAVVASLPFAPEIVIPTVRHLAGLDLGMTKPYGFKPSFNQTFAVPDSPTGWWVTPHHFGIDQGPVVLAIENYRTGLLWEIMRRCPYIVAGLRRAGFTGGWLSGIMTDDRSLIDRKTLRRFVAGDPGLSHLRSPRPGVA